ncbi:unnamed protein product, partial [Polarella glacialis]
TERRNSAMLRRWNAEKVILRGEQSTLVPFSTEGMSKPAVAPRSASDGIVIAGRTSSDEDIHCRLPPILVPNSSSEVHDGLKAGDERRRVSCDWVGFQRTVSDPLASVPLSPRRCSMVAVRISTEEDEVFPALPPQRRVASMELTKALQGNTSPRRQDVRRISISEITAPRHRSKESFRRKSVTAVLPRPVREEQKPKAIEETLEQKTARFAKKFGMTAVEVRLKLELFESLDVNGDGTLSEKEFQVLIRRHCGIPDADPIPKHLL